MFCCRSRPHFRCHKHFLIKQTKDKNLSFPYVVWTQRERESDFVTVWKFYQHICCLHPGTVSHSHYRLPRSLAMHYWFSSRTNKHTNPHLTQTDGSKVSTAVISFIEQNNSGIALATYRPMSLCRLINSWITIEYCLWSPSVLQENLWMNERVRRRRKHLT